MALAKLILNNIIDLTKAMAQVVPIVGQVNSFFNVILRVHMHNTDRMTNSMQCFCVVVPCSASASQYISDHHITNEITDTEEC